jgi:hypothetical protein
MGSDKETDVTVKQQRFQQIYGTVIRTLDGDVRKETLSKFYKIMASPTLVLDTNKTTKG